MICDKHSDEEVDSSSGQYLTKYVRNMSRYVFSKTTRWNFEGLRGNLSRWPMIIATFEICRSAELIKLDTNEG